jgi:hypothetical protein
MGHGRADRSPVTQFPFSGPAVSGLPLGFVLSRGGSVRGLGVPAQ